MSQSVGDGLSSHATVTPTMSTLSTILQTRAAEQPARQAFTFLADDRSERVICYGELDHRARAIAGKLRQMSQIGDRVLLLLPPGIDYITSLFACFYAGCIAVPAYPPRRNSTLDRLESIVQDTEAVVAIATQSLIGLNDALSELGKGTLTVVAVEDFESADADALEMATLSAADIALLQYTSGSTDMPRGVMVSHGNLMHNSTFICQLYGHSADSQGVIWLPPYHDMGLIGGIIQPIFAGFPCTLMSPMTFLQRPIRWLESIGRYGGTTSGGPNFAYDLCVKRVKPEQKASLDLSSWAVAFNGAEPIASESLDRFADYFADCGFRREAFLPCYGLAEATLMVVGVKKEELPSSRVVSSSALRENKAIPASPNASDTQTIVSCGHSHPDQEVLVVNPETNQPCENGCVGEVWVQGPSVASGYWQRPDATEVTFAGKLQGDERRFLVTGDLGVFIDGHLFVVGRKKEVLIIRGRNYYPHDLEATVEKCDPIIRSNCGAAFTVEVDDEQRLVLVHEIDKRVVEDEDSLVWNIRQAISKEHQLQAYGIELISRRALPKTTSGKVQRNLCRELYLAGQLNPIVSWTMS